MAKQNPIKKELIKGVEKCIKCKGRSWIMKRLGFHIVYKCQKCGYVFDWLDYIGAGTINVNGITVINLTKDK